MHSSSTKWTRLILRCCAGNNGERLTSPSLELDHCADRRRGRGSRAMEGERECRAVKVSMARHARTIARARRGGRAARTALRPKLVEDAVPAHPAANRVVWLQVVHDAAVCAGFFVCASFRTNRGQRADASGRRVRCSSAPSCEQRGRALAVRVRSWSRGGGGRLTAAEVLHGLDSTTMALGPFLSRRTLKITATARQVWRRRQTLRRCPSPGACSCSSRPFTRASLS